MANPTRNEDEDGENNLGEITDWTPLKHKRRRSPRSLPTITDSPKDALRLVQIVAAGMLLSFKKDEIDTETVCWRNQRLILRDGARLEKCAASIRRLMPPPRRMDRPRGPSRCSLPPARLPLTNSPTRRSALRKQEHP